MSQQFKNQTSKATDISLPTSTSLQLQLPDGARVLIKPDQHLPHQELKFNQELWETDNYLLFGALASVPALKSKITGEVISSSKSGFWVSYGGKTEAFAHKNEHDNDTLKVGDVCVFEVISQPDDSGCIDLSRKGGKLWEKLSEAHTQGEIVSVDVLNISRKFNKITTLKVRYENITGIIPFSLLGVSAEKAEELLHKKLEVKVHELCASTGKLVFNRRVIVNEEIVQREIFLNSLAPGQILNDVEVIGILSNSSGSQIGVLVQTEGCRGLIHHSEIPRSYFRDSLENVFTPGKKLNAIVLPFRERQNKKRELALSLKALQGQKEKEFFANHKCGDVLEGTVERKVGYGLFLSLDTVAQVDGLLHTSEFPKDHEPSLGSKVIVEIIAINKERKTVGLSMRKTGSR